MDEEQFETLIRWHKGTTLRLDTIGDDVRRVRERQFLMGRALESLERNVAEMLLQLQRIKGHLAEAERNPAHVLRPPSATYDITPSNDVADLIGPGE